MTQMTLQDIIKQEYIKCAASPVYFMKKYCYIQHPIRGKILFELYPFQEQTLMDLMNNIYNIILKSRQLGISTLTAGYALWLMIFQNDKNVLVLATKQDVAKNLVTKVKEMYDNLPSWLRRNAQTVENNKTSMRFKNGSQIKAVSAAKDSARSEALSLLVIDEAAFIDYIDDIWTSAQATLSTGGQCIALSTPNGVNNWFHKNYIEAESGKGRFHPIKLHWSVHPERNEAWRKEQDLLLGHKAAAQECLSGDTIVTIKDNETGKLFDITLEELYGLI